jgi:hypothetical protein
VHRVSRRTAILNLVCLVAAPAWGHAAGAGAVEPPLAIKGYDPVAYFTQSKPVRGREDLEHEWDERRYRFSSPQHRELFRADPLRYAPQFPDFCAVSLTRGEVVDASPENWLISDGKLYMFGKAIGPELFRQNLAENVNRANDNRRLLPKR